MKRFLKKRWHNIPVGIISAILVLGLVAGGVFAAYPFLKADIQVDVEEAIAVGCFDTWDNLHPYGSDAEAEWVDGDAGSGTLGDVDVALGETEDAVTITINSNPEEGYDGYGFVAGEWIVIPINIRSGSSGELTLGASVTENSDGLDLDYCFRTNNSPVTDIHPDGDLAYSFKDDGNWASLKDWNVTISGLYGKSGSARVGAKVLFVKISAPGDAVPGTYTCTVTLNRS